MTYPIINNLNEAYHDKVFIFIKPNKFTNLLL